MYIPYSEISKFLAFFLPKSVGKELTDWGNNKKISQNLEYIERNRRRLIPKLKNKRVLRVAFYVYDEAKWKCETLYRQMRQNDRFDPFIVVTKNNCKLKNNANYQTSKDVKKCYQFFKSNGYNVKLGYNHGFIPFKKFEPDIIIYQHPWYVEKSQGPVVCSKFALTCYVPYFLPTAIYAVDYYLRFHQYVENYYVLNDELKEEYSTLMANKGSNIKVVGHPFLDYFSTNSFGEKKYIIYAPHWTVAHQGISCSTFEKYGKFMLEYAHKHPEYEWVFKPHPLLFKSLIKNNVMTEQEARAYYNEWAKVGITYEMGDYIDIFNKTQLLISDSSSFLVEFFMTESPVIYLVSDPPTKFCKSIKRIVNTYYPAKSIDDLKTLLEALPENDYAKKIRLQVKETAGLENSNAAKNIIDDIINQLS